MLLTRVIMNQPRMWTGLASRAFAADCMPRRAAGTPWLLQSLHQCLFTKISPVISLCQSLNLLFCLHCETTLSLQLTQLFGCSWFFAITSILWRVGSYCVTFYRKDNCCPKSKWLASVQRLGLDSAVVIFWKVWCNYSISWTPQLSFNVWLPWHKWNNRQFWSVSKKNLDKERKNMVGRRIGSYFPLMLGYSVSCKLSN